MERLWGREAGGFGIGDDLGGLEEYMGLAILHFSIIGGVEIRVYH